jgi:hypothetical protein
MSIGRLSVPKGWTTQAAMSAITAEPEHGWIGEPIRLVKAGEPPG